MTAFKVAVHTNTPAALPFIVEAMDRSKLQQYEHFCFYWFGAKASNGKSPVWFQSKGYFFFATKSMRDRFILGANSARLPSDYHTGAAASQPDFVARCIERIVEAYR